MLNKEYILSAYRTPGRRVKIKRTVRILEITENNTTNREKHNEHLTKRKEREM